MILRQSVSDHSAQSILTTLALVLAGAACAGQRPPVEAPPPAPIAIDTTIMVVDTLPPAWALEQPFSFPSGEATLAGTLTLPPGGAGNGLLPVALIVAGSGPTDRDGNNIPVLATNTYAQLAWGLARYGIASLRYDKRGVGGSPLVGDPTALTTDVFMEDAAAGVQALHQDGRFSRVFIIGHSEGAQLALQSANRGAAVAGVVMISAVGRPIQVVLREQVARLLEADELVQFDTALARYLRGEEPGDVPPALRPLFLPQNQRFIQSMAEYDAAEELRRATVPVLLVHGRRDIQITDADFDALVAARPQVDTLVLPRANHTLKRTDATDAMGQLPTYRDRTIPIDPLVVPGIAEWIRK